MKHLHHKIIGYKARKGNQITEGVEIIVDNCKTEKEAVIKAKSIVNRKGYLLQKVWECDSCTDSKEQLANQRYLSALLSNFLKKHD